MIDITRKYMSLRTAKAVAYLNVSELSIEAIKNKSVPKGDVFECSRVAGIMSAKTTHNTLPHCHPIPVEFTSVNHKLLPGNQIEVEVVVKTIYKTGCEMEALHAASVAALTIYDMLKPIDKHIEIHSIKLLEKTGGKSDMKADASDLKAAVIVISDSVFNKTAKDQSGKYLEEKLKELGFNEISVHIVSDEIASIQETVNKHISAETDLIISTGGTGLSPRDRTFEAVKPLLEAEIPGIMEAARDYSQNLTRFAMLSRGIAGFSRQSLILTLPGSTSACKDYMHILFPSLLHIFKVRNGEKHGR